MQTADRGTPGSIEWMRAIVKENTNLHIELTIAQVRNTELRAKLERRSRPSWTRALFVEAPSIAGWSVFVLALLDWVTS